jgi:hypothetical protein
LGYLADSARAEVAQLDADHNADAMLIQQEAYALWNGGRAFLAFLSNSVDLEM